MKHMRFRMSYRKAWSHNEVVDLIAMYKAMPCLWEVNSPEYKDRNKRNHCLTEMASHFNTSTTEISRKIHNLRSQFHSERQKLLKRKSIYGNHHRCIVSKWPHFDSLRFLKRSITKKYIAGYSDYQPENETNYNDNHDNMGGGTAEPTSTVNVKQEPVDITESEQDMLVVMKDDNEMNDGMEAHSSRMEQHSSKSEPQNSKPEAHYSKMEMHYSSHNKCKAETCCNKVEAHFSRSEPFFGKTEVQCGMSDMHNNRSDMHNNRSDMHNNRSEIQTNLSQPHSSRSDPHSSRSDPQCSRSDPQCSRSDPQCSRSDPQCSRTEPFRLLKIEPNTDRVNRRNDHSEASPFLIPEPPPIRRLQPGRNSIQHSHCPHRADSISSTLMDSPSFSSINEVTHNDNKREKQWKEEDPFEIFGKFVAQELRSLNSECLRKKMKRKIQKAILDVCEEEEH